MSETSAREGRSASERAAPRPEKRAGPALPTSELVTQLTARLRPVRRLWRPSARLAVVALLQLAVSGIAAVVLGVRSDLATGARGNRVAGEVAAVAALATACVVMALLIAIPGREPWRRVVIATVAAAALGLATSFALLPEGDTTGFVATGWPCAVRTMLVAAVPWVVLFVAVHRAATLFPARAGMLAGAGSLLFAAASVRMACPADSAAHLLVWHLVPVLVGVLASTLVGTLCLPGGRRGWTEREGAYSPSFGRTSGFARYGGRSPRR